jgi:hypothetical protein
MISERASTNVPKKPQSPADIMIKAIQDAETPEKLGEVADMVMSNATMLDHSIADHSTDTEVGEVVFRAPEVAATPAESEEYPVMEMVFSDPEQQETYQTMIADLELPIGLAIRSTAERVTDGDEGVVAMDKDGTIIPQEDVMAVAEGIARGFVESSAAKGDQRDSKKQIVRWQNGNDWYVVNQAQYNDVVKQTMIEVMQEPGLVDALKRKASVAARVGARIYKRLMERLAKSAGIKDEITVDTEENEHDLARAAEQGIISVEWDQDI